MTKTGTEDERVSKMIKGNRHLFIFCFHFLFTLGQKEKKIHIPVFIYLNIPAYLFLKSQLKQVKLSKSYDSNVMDQRVMASRIQVV